MPEYETLLAVGLLVAVFWCAHGLAKLLAWVSCHLLFFAWVLYRWLRRRLN